MGSWTSTLLYTCAGLVGAQKLRRLYRHLRYGRNAQQQQEFLQRYEEVKRKRQKIREDFISIIAAIHPQCRAQFEKPESWLTLTERSAEDQIKDFALAEGRNKLLLELAPGALTYIPTLPDAVANKYLVKTTAFPVLHKPFVFSQYEDQVNGNYAFRNVPPRFEWKITSIHQPYQIIFELKEWCAGRGNNPIQFSELLEFRKYAPVDFLAKIVPTNETIIPWFVLHLVPCLLHDVLHSTWSFKYIFGGLSYLLSFVFSSIAITDQKDILIIAAAVFYGIQNLYLPYKYYPSSLHYFNFQGLFLTAIGYYKLAEKYSQLARLSTTQRRITNLVLLGLLGFSNNWPRFLNVHNNSPDVFWSAFKANSISAGIIFMNFYLYFVGRLFVDNDQNNLRVVFNWNGITILAAMAVSTFAFFATVYYPHIIS